MGIGNAKKNAAIFRLVFAYREERALKLADMKSVCSKAETPFLMEDVYLLMTTHKSHCRLVHIGK